MGDRSDQPAVLPYGSWPTPISSAVVTGAARAPTDGVRSGKWLFWSEARPDEGGRTALCARCDGEHIELLPDGVSARSTAHEYGGGAWWAHGDVVWYCDFATQRLMRVQPGEAAVAVTAEPPSPRVWRYADGDVSPDGSTIACVLEDHAVDAHEPRNVVVTLAANEPSATPTVVADGADFVLGPRWSPDGASISWVEWNHPNMPWDETRLMVRNADGATTVVAGSHERESICQADWAADGSLWFSSDRTGWWSLYRWDPATGVTATMVALDGADIGFPAWNLGERCFVVTASGACVFWYSSGGVHRLGRRRADGVVEQFAVPFTFMTSLMAQSDGEGVTVVAASPTMRPALIALADSSTAGAPRWEVLVAAADSGIDSAFFSMPQAITFPTPAADSPAVAHALYYPPTNPDVAAPDGELPPLLVMIHGGPTAAARAMLSLSTQFWTSRGFAVVDVNYRGSTGYGREFRDLLRDQWGVADVEDCVAAARYLADQGLADPQRLLIRGGSAGGFTTLAALAFHDTFAAGASHYGVADLGALAAETHKFEARYLDLLVGPWPAAKPVYDARSPINHIDSFDRPLIVFQGSDDLVVPPNQSEMVVEALRTKRVPVAYVLFDGEGHGFRRAENQRAALDGELSFYAQVLGFELPAAEAIPPVAITNL